MPKKRGKRKKACQFCVDQVKVVDYKLTNTLQRYLSERSKIVPRRVTGNCARHQRQMTLAMKRARQMALLPYTSE